MLTLFCFLQPAARFAGVVAAADAAAGRRAAVAARAHRQRHVHPAAALPRVARRRRLPRAARPTNPRLPLHRPRAPQPHGAAHVPQADAPLARRGNGAPGTTHRGSSRRTRSPGRGSPGYNSYPPPRRPDPRPPPPRRPRHRGRPPSREPRRPRLSSRIAQPSFR